MIAFSAEFRQCIGMNLSEAFQIKGSFLCRDGLAKSRTKQISNKKLCFTSTDKDFLAQTLFELSQLPECQFVKMSAAAKDGMYLGRCFFTDDTVAGKFWSIYKSNKKLMCNIQDDDFAKPYREPDVNSPSIKPQAVIIQQPTLQTSRLILEPYKDSDVSDIFNYASHPEVSKFVPWESHKTIDDSHAFLDYIKKSTSLIKGKLFFVFAIRLKESGKVIGSIDFKNTNQICGQIDYALGFKYWNQEIATEAATAIRDWALEHLPEMVRLQAFCVEENLGSSRVMEKIGMTREGIRRKAFLLKGAPVNLVDYSIVR